MGLAMKAAEISATFQSHNKNYVSQEFKLPAKGCAGAYNPRKINKKHYPGDIIVTTGGGYDQTSSVLETCVKSKT